MKSQLFIIISLAILLGYACNEPVNEPKLIFTFKFDSTQVRLNNIGLPSFMPSNHRAQHPSFKAMGAHYIELATGIIPLGAGEILYHAPETTLGGDNAIDFQQAKNVGEGEAFFEIPLKDIQPGNYDWLRVSLAYQKYDIKYRINPPTTPVVFDGTGTISSFIGYRTYITDYFINNQSVAVNGNRLQGYWGFETNLPIVGPYVVTGQAPPGATTVPNPLFGQSDIPPGSCVVTGQFASPLVITGNETEDIHIVVSLSVNNSFEWKENGNNNFYEPLDGDTVVDMGIRGLIPYIQ